MYSQSTQQTKFCQAKNYISYFWQFQNKPEDFDYKYLHDKVDLLEMNAFLATQDLHYLMSNLLALKEIQAVLIPVYQAKLINYFKSLEIAFKDELKLKLS